MPACTISGDWLCSRTFAVCTVIIPPLGMASRALTIRLSSTCSTCAGSASTCGTDSARSSRNCTSVPISRRAIRATPPTISLMSSGHRLEHLLAAEGQQLARQRRGAIGGVQDLVDLRGHRRIRP